MTTTSSEETGLYRSRASRDASDHASTVAAMVASILAAVGAVAMIIGIGAALGWLSMGGAHAALLIGLGLVGIGAGALLLVILQTWQIFRRS